MAKKKQIGLASLVLMVFTTVFGFANSPVAFYQMGYASIFWYVIAAILFFLPASLMIAEYGSAMPDAEGGIFSWLEFSVGERFAFVGTFIWLANWLIWMVSTSSKIWIPMSSLIFGSDKTTTWAFFGLTATQFVGILAILWMVVCTFTASHGVDKIQKIGSLGGTMVSIMSVLFVVIAIVIWIAQKGMTLQPIHGVRSFFVSPNPNFQTPIALLSFVVYAIFAYGGIEAVGTLTDSMDDPAKTFPKGMVISMVVITILYALMILFWGVCTNWQKVLSGKNVTLGNITYVLMNNAGVVMGDALGWSHGASLILGNILTRFAGLGMFCAYVGSFFVMVYSPLKALVLGSDKRLWPEKMTKLNKYGMPSFAMWLQFWVIAILIFAISFGGSGAQKFYQILTNMANVASSAPYLFIVGAFPFFKKRTGIKRPFVFFKTQASANAVSIVVFLVVAFGIIFTCLNPILTGDYQTAFWTIFGPVFFGLVALFFYNHEAKKHGVKNTNEINKG